VIFQPFTYGGRYVKINYRVPRSSYKATEWSYTSFRKPWGKIRPWSKVKLSGFGNYGCQSEMKTHNTPQADLPFPIFIFQKIKVKKAKKDNGYRNKH